MAGLEPPSGPARTRSQASPLLLLLRAAFGCGPRARGLRSERIVGQPVPDLAAAAPRNAEIAAHLELLAIRAELHQRAVNRSIARIHDRPILVGHSVALHSLDQRKSQHRSAFLGAFALVADPILILAWLLEDLDDVAFVGAVALNDLEPALGLPGVLVDLFPQAHGCRVGGAQRDARGGHHCDSAQRDGTRDNQFQQRPSHHNTCDLFEPEKLFDPDAQSGGFRHRPMASDCGDFAETFNVGEFPLTPPRQPGGYPVLQSKKAANFMAFRGGAEGKGRPARAGTSVRNKTG